MDICNHIPKKHDSKIHTALRNVVKNRPQIHSHKYFQAQNSGRSFAEAVWAGALFVALCHLVMYFLIFVCLLWSFPQHFSREGWTCVLPSAMRSWSVALPRCPPQGTKPLLFCTSWWEIILSSPKGERFWELIFRSVAGEKLESRTLQI